MKFAIALIGLLLVSPARAQIKYHLDDLSEQDITTLGAGVDKLPREMGDAGDLVGRLGRQITEERAKYAADLRAAQEAEIRKKIEAEKAAPSLEVPK